MATDHQKRANQLNAKRSTGPKSSQGKGRSSKNAIKHGLNATLDSLSPETQSLQALFIEDGLSQDEALQLAEAHIARARVRKARQQAWLDVYNSADLDPDDRGTYYWMSEEHRRDMDLTFGGKYWRALATNALSKPFVDQNDRNEQVTLEFLEQQRRLNRYDVRAVSQLTKRYKRAYGSN